MSIIVVMEWEKFQHYKDRAPPWIKLYRELLTSESWVLGTDVSRLLQVAIMLLAARYHNATPLNFGLLKKVANLDMTEAHFNKAIAHLKATKFLKIQEVTKADYIVLQDASSVLASCTSEERRGETEERREDQSEGLNGHSHEVGKRSRKAPPDFVPDATFALSLIPDLDLETESGKFKDYEFKSPRSDWPAVWRNWVRNAKDRNQYSRRGATVRKWE